MFETLVVSRSVARPDRRAGTAAMLLHLLALALALHQRQASVPPAPTSSTPIAFLIPRAAQPRPSLPGAPAPIAGPSAALSAEELKLPALPGIESIGEGATLDVRRMLGSDNLGSATGGGLMATLAAGPQLPDAAQVDRPPLLARPIEPAYPPALRAAGFAGEVVVEYAVGLDGRVDSSSVRVVQTTHPGFVPSVVAALGAARFTPAQRAGSAVAVRVRQRIVFQVH
jgi:TonB family protein